MTTMSIPEGEDVHSDLVPAALCRKLLVEGVVCAAQPRLIVRAIEGVVVPCLPLSNACINAPSMLQRRHCGKEESACNLKLMQVR